MLLRKRELEAMVREGSLGTSQDLPSLRRLDLEGSLRLRDRIPGGLAAYSVIYLMLLLFMDVAGPSLLHAALLLALGVLTLLRYLNLRSWSSWVRQPLSFRRFQWLSACTMMV